MGNRDAEKRILSNYENLKNVINVNHIVKALEDDM